MKQQAANGPRAGRHVAEGIAERMKQGESFADAMEPSRQKFPPLFLELVRVGEETGRLAETFEALEEYFESARAAKRTLIQAMVWPVFMFCSALTVITLLILVMGLIPGGFDPIGLGLTGPTGALVFLMIVSAVVGLGLFLLNQSKNDQAFRSRLEGSLVGVPVIGDCLRAFALQRFSLSLAMTTAAGLRADRSVKMSLKATANRAYAMHADNVARRIRKGEEIAATLQGLGPHLFPTDFVSMVETGEQSGELAEVMERLAKEYHQEASRKLRTAAMVAGGAVYAGVAIMVIFMIFRIASAIGSIYQNALQGF